MSCFSYFHGYSNRRQEALQLLFCEGLFKTASCILVKFPSSFFTICFVTVHIVHLYFSLEAYPARKVPHFILLERLDLQTIDMLPVAFHTFDWYLLKSFSIDVMLVPMYLNGSSNFIGLPITVEMAWFYLKQLLSVFLVIILMPMLPAACAMLCWKDFTWAGVFAKRAWSSA